MSESGRPVTGFVGLGDQGLPIAVAIAEAGYSLHVWDRRSASVNSLGSLAHVRHENARDLAASCDIVGLCVSTDDDVMEVVTAGLLDGLRPRSVVVNHGTGTPQNAMLLSDLCGRAGVDSLDAPVSGGRLASQERRLTTMVGGTESVAQRCTPVFDSFSKHVVYMGGPGAGQTAKLFNNALLALNQASIVDIVDLAGRSELDLDKLIQVLKLGSASSAALELLNTMVTLETVNHLAAVQTLDMHLFEAALIERGVDAASVTARGIVGIAGMPALLRRLNPAATSPPSRNELRADELSAGTGEDR